MCVRNSLRLLIWATVFVGSGSTFGQTCLEYRVNQNYKKVVAAVERVMNEPRTRKVKVPDLPAYIEGADVVYSKIEIDAVNRKYNATIKYKRGALFLEHRVKLWWTGNDYSIEAYINIDWCATGFGSRVANCVARRIVVPRAEMKFLCIEKAKVYEYSDRIDTVEVEQPDSWVLILVDAVRLLKRAIAMREEQ